MIVVLTAPAEAHSRTRYEFSAMEDVDLDDETLHRVRELQVLDEASQHFILRVFDEFGARNNMGSTPRWPSDRPMRLFGDMAKFMIANFLGR